MTEAFLQDLSETDYLQMEEALSQTSRGRAFLRMRDRRSRVVAIDEFQRIAGALERQVSRLCTVDPAATVAAAPRLGDGNHALHEELSAISQHMQQTRSDIAALRPADSGASRIEAATNELDAIVAATESATSDILNAVERIGEWAQRIPRTDEDQVEIAEAIDAWTMEVLTACSFQDITGQRITKVVNTLRYIEQRVNTMIEIWGVDRGAAAAPTAALGSAGDASTSHRKMNDTRPDAHLLNGPSEDGVSQDDIDALFDNIATEMPQVFERAEPAVALAAPAPMRAPPPPPAPPPAPAPAPAAARKPTASSQPPASASSGDGISQSDIDALFA